MCTPCIPSRSLDGFFSSSFHKNFCIPGSILITSKDKVGESGHVRERKGDQCCFAYANSCRFFFSWFLFDRTHTRATIHESRARRKEWKASPLLVLSSGYDNRFIIRSSSFRTRINNKQHTRICSQHGLVQTGTWLPAADFTPKNGERTEWIRTCQSRRDIFLSSLISLSLLWSIRSEKDRQIKSAQASKARWHSHQCFCVCVYRVFAWWEDRRDLVT